MNIDKVYPSKYLKAGDVGETPVTYTIDDYKIEEVGRDKDEKLVLYFKRESKGFVCNKTNLNTIAKALGTKETDEWIGKAIKLYSTEVSFGDEMVEAIRVSLKPGKPVERGSSRELETAPVKGDPDWRKSDARDDDDDSIPY